PREPGKIVGRPVIAEIVEQQKRIRLCGVAETECTPQSDARTFDGWLRLHDAFDGTDGHRFSCLSLSPMRRQAGRETPQGVVHWADKAAILRQIAIHIWNFI